MKLFLDENEVKRIIKLYENSDLEEQDEETLKYLKSELEEIEK